MKPRVPKEHTILMDTYGEFLVDVSIDFGRSYPSIDFLVKAWKKTRSDHGLL